MRINAYPHQPIWCLNVAPKVAAKYIIAFRDGPVPVIYYLRTGWGEFDQYSAYRRHTDGKLIGAAEYVEAYVSIMPSDPLIGRSFLGIPLERRSWARSNVWVSRTLLLPDIKLPSGSVVDAHRVSKHFANTGLPVAAKSFAVQDAQFIAWAQPHVEEALSATRFAEQMLTGTTEMWSILDGISQRPSRSEYEGLCLRFKMTARNDSDLETADTLNVYPSRFPDVSVLDAVRSHVHLYRKFAIFEEKYPD